MDKSIKEAILRFARNNEDEDSMNRIIDFILNDPLQIDLLVEAMRVEAMRELGKKPEDDFLPAHLRQCSPKAFSESHIFDDYDYGIGVSACAPANGSYLMSNANCFSSTDMTLKRTLYTEKELIMPSAPQRTLLDILKEDLLSD